MQDLELALEKIEQIVKKVEANRRLVALFHLRKKIMKQQTTRQRRRLALPASARRKSRDVK